MVTIFTHTDLDGVGCGLLLEHYHQNEDVEIRYVDYSQVDELVVDYVKNIKLDDMVYITDISVSDEVCRLLDGYKNIKLIDHHINKNTEHLNKYKWCIRQGTKDDGSMCSATWLVNEYIVKTDNKFLKDIIINIDDYDTWNFSKNGNKTAKDLNDLMYMVGKDEFLNIIQEQYNENKPYFTFNKTINTLLQARKNEYDHYLKSIIYKVYPFFYEKYSVGVCFAEKFISELGNDLYEYFNGRYDIIAIINIKNNTMSLRGGNNSIHLGDIANELSKKLNTNGGGHKSSAGLSLPVNLKFDLIKNIFK